VIADENSATVSSRIRQMDRGDTTQGLENPGEDADSYFHPLSGHALSGLKPALDWNGMEISLKFKESTKSSGESGTNPDSPDRLAVSWLPALIPLAGSGTWLQMGARVDEHATGEKGNRRLRQESCGIRACRSDSMGNPG